MTLQPPTGYGPEEADGVAAPEPISAPLPDHSAKAPRPGLQPDSPANAVSAPAEGAPVEPPPGGIGDDLLSEPPIGLDVVGGRTVRLRKAVALDRVASGYGFLTVSWNQRAQGLDLVALQENSSITVRGHGVAIDLSQPLGRVLVGTGTRGTRPLPPSELVVSNGATQVVVPILGGTSLGVWPRLSISRVDQFVVVRHELDALSGVLGAVAGAYGYDERTFVLANTT